MQVTSTVREVQVAAPVAQAVHVSKAVVEVVWKKPAVGHSQRLRVAVFNAKPVAQVKQFPRAPVAPPAASHVKHPAAHGSYTKLVPAV